LREYSADLPAQVVKWCAQEDSPWIEYNRPALRQRFELAAYRLSHAALQPVSLHCFAHRSRSRKPEPRRQRIILFFVQRERNKITARHTDTGFVDLAKFSRPEDPSWFGK
jgi:hypothetical protein